MAKPSPNVELSRFCDLSEVRVLGVSVPVADRPVSRLLGLAWLDIQSDLTGLLIPSCRSVHTFGMRFFIDIYFLDAKGAIVRSETRVGRNRTLFCRRARSVLELVSG